NCCYVTGVSEPFRFVRTFLPVLREPARSCLLAPAGLSCAFEESHMEPNADGIGEIAEITSDVLPGAPVVDDALAALVANGHAEEKIDGDAFDLRHMLQALQ